MRQQKTNQVTVKIHSYGATIPITVFLRGVADVLDELNMTFTDKPVAIVWREGGITVNGKTLITREQVEAYRLENETES